MNELNKKENKVNNVVDDYHNGYETLKLELIEHKADMPFIKTAVDEICNNYIELFKLDFFAFFQQYKDEVPLVIYSVLMRVELRDLFLNNEFLKIDLKKFVLSSQAALNELFKDFYDCNSDSVDEVKAAKDSVYGSIASNMFGGQTDGNSDSVDEVKAAKYYFYESIGLKMFCGQTDGYWKDLEVKNKQVIVLSIPQGTFVRSLGKPDEELSVDDTNCNFHILNGLDYKSNNTTESLVYMEL